MYQVFLYIYHSNWYLLSENASFQMINCQTFSFALDLVKNKVHVFLGGYRIAAVDHPEEVDEALGSHGLVANEQGPRHYQTLFYQRSNLEKLITFRHIYLINNKHVVW